MSNNLENEEINNLLESKNDSNDVIQSNEEINIIENNVNDNNKENNVNDNNKENNVNDKVKENIIDIVSIITEALLNNETMEKISIQISQNEKNIISSVLNTNPELFKDIQSTINTIIVDNTIDLSDLPQLLSIQKNIIDIIKKISNIKIDKNKIPNFTSNILKFIIRILLKENLINISNHDEFLVKFDKLIDSITELINFFNTIQTPWCNVNWTNLFSCKK